MNVMRAFAIALSLAAHASLAWALVRPASDSRYQAFDAGSGEDQFVVEQGIGIESIVKLGEAAETVRTAAITPVEAPLPVPVREVKPVDEIDAAITSKAVTAVEDNIVKTEEPLPPEFKPHEAKPVEPAEQPVQVAIAKEASTGTARLGGDPMALAEYRGKLAKLFQECKFPPKKKVVGNAQVRIIVDDEGQVVRREIAKSSGDPKVDEAALANVDYAVRDCKDEGMPKAPEGLTVTDRTVLQGYTFK